jgi:hypothetical protein
VLDAPVLEVLDQLVRNQVFHGSLQRWAKRVA